jgi:hypothetical protein
MMMRKIDELVTGSTVVFTKKPPGSWLSENTPYVIEGNSGKSVHFRNPATGGGTYDTDFSVEYSAFTVQGAE